MSRNGPGAYLIVEVNDSGTVLEYKLYDRGFECR
jgi:hypothetical protein